MIPILLVSFVLGGHPAVKCDETSGHTGWTHAGVVHLAPSVCAYTTLSDPQFQAFGLYVTLHEAAHLAGVEDEHAADCRALRWIIPAARTVLHASPARARLLYRWAAAFHAQQPAPYAGTCS